MGDKVIKLQSVKVLEYKRISPQKTPKEYASHSIGQARKALKECHFRVELFPG